MNATLEEKINVSTTKMYQCGKHFSQKNVLNWNFTRLIKFAVSDIFKLNLSINKSKNEALININLLEHHGGSVNNILLPWTENLTPNNNKTHWRSKFTNVLMKVKNLNPNKKYLTLTPRKKVLYHSYKQKLMHVCKLNNILKKVTNKIKTVRL